MFINEASIETISQPIETRKFAENFTDEKLNQLTDVINKIAVPESAQQEVATWDKLSEQERTLLIKRYGQPIKITREVQVVDYTRGDACADNERGLPSSFESDNFGVWDQNLLVYALYGETPNVSQSTKIRVVPKGLVVGINSTILLPNFFYTPSGRFRRELLIAQMNKNPRGDKSLKLAPEHENGIIETDALQLTIYRQLGSSSGGDGDRFEDSGLGTQAIQELGTPYVDFRDFTNRQRLTIEISQRVQQKIADIISTSNMFLIKKAFDNQANIVRFQMKKTLGTVHMKNIETGKENLLWISDVEKQHGEFSAVKDPTWRHEGKPPLVYRYTYEVDGKRQEKFCYVGNAEVLLEVKTV